MWAYILYGYDNMNTMSASGHTLQVGVTMLLLLLMMMMTNDDAVLISCTYGSYASGYYRYQIPMQSYVGLRAYLPL